MSKRNTKTYLHWVAAGDEFPDRIPDWLLNLWPSRPLHWTICALFGHEPSNGPTWEPNYCVWCHRDLATARGETP